MSCEGCKDKLILMDSKKESAKKIANEKRQAQAICKEDSTGETFITSATTAFEQRFHILQIVSGHQD